MQVTHHAKIQFLKRKGDINDAEEATPRMLRGAERQILFLYEESDIETVKDHPGLIRRLIDNEWCEAQYYRRGKWRLVVCNDRIITIEQNQYSGSRKSKGRPKTKQVRKWSEGHGKHRKGENNV